jgi:hypothetical protein
MASAPSIPASIRSSPATTGGAGSAGAAAPVRSVARPDAATIARIEAASARIRLRGRGGGLR